MYFQTTKSPYGPITLFAETNNIVALEFGSIAEEKPSKLLKAANDQLKAYFEGQIKHFDLPLSATGTVFQRQVWKLVLKIPYGTTKSYGEVAQELGCSPRSIGQACGKNPIPIIIPCHRVLGANYKIGGFSAGFGPATKKALLRLESTTKKI